MDNEYTRKQEICPLVWQFCNCDDKNCNRCIAEELEWQERQWRELQSN